MADDVTIKIGAKDDAGKVLKKISKDVDNFGKKFSKSSDTVVGSTKQMLTAFKGLAAGVGVLAAVRVGIAKLDSLDNLAKTSQKLGVTANELLGLRTAAERFSGVSAGTLDMALQRMTRRLSEAARGTGEAQNAINELGLDARKLNVAGPAQAFKKIAEAIKQVQNPADRLRLSFKFFDSEGAVLATTLAKGSAGLEEMAKRSLELNGNLTAARLDGIEKASDAIADLKASFSGLGSEIAVVVAGPLTNFSLNLANIISQVRDLKPRDFLPHSGVIIRDVPKVGAQVPVEEMGFARPDVPAKVGPGPFADVFPSDAMRNSIQRFFDRIPKQDPFKDIFPASVARPALENFFKKLLPQRDRSFFGLKSQAANILQGIANSARMQGPFQDVFAVDRNRDIQQRPELGVARESRLLGGAGANINAQILTEQKKTARAAKMAERQRATAERQRERMLRQQNDLFAEWDKLRVELIR